MSFNRTSTNTLNNASGSSTPLNTGLAVANTLNKTSGSSTPLNTGLAVANTLNKPSGSSTPLNILNNNNNNNASISVSSRLLNVLVGLVGKAIGFELSLVGKLFGINSTEDVGTQIRNAANRSWQIKEAMQTPEGKEALNNLADILVLFIQEEEKPMDKLREDLNITLRKESKELESIVVDVLSDVFPVVFSAIKTVLDSGVVIANVMEGTAEATGIMKNEVTTVKSFLVKIQQEIEMLENLALQQHQPTSVLQNVSGTGLAVRSGGGNSRKLMNGGGKEKKEISRRQKTLRRMKLMSK